MSRKQIQSSRKKISAHGNKTGMSGADALFPDCVKRTTKYFSERSGPPYDANDPPCHGTRTFGNNGKVYESKKSASGTFRWYTVKTVSKAKKGKKKTALKGKRSKKDASKSSKSKSLLKGSDLRKQRKKLKSPSGLGGSRIVMRINAQTSIEIPIATWSEYAVIQKGTGKDSGMVLKLLNNSKVRRLARNAGLEPKRLQALVNANPTDEKIVMFGLGQKLSTGDVQTLRQRDREYKFNLSSPVKTASPATQVKPKKVVSAASLAVPPKPPSPVPTTKPKKVVSAASLAVPPKPPSPVPTTKPKKVVSAASLAVPPKPAPSTPVATPKKVVSAATPRLPASPPPKPDQGKRLGEAVRRIERKEGFNKRRDLAKRIRGKPAFLP